MFVKEHYAIANLTDDVPHGKREFLDMIRFLSRTRLAYAMHVDLIIFSMHIKRFKNTANVETMDGVDRLRGEITLDLTLVITEATIREFMRFGNDGDYELEYDESEILQTFNILGRES